MFKFVNCERHALKRQGHKRSQTTFPAKAYWPTVRHRGSSIVVIQATVKMLHCDRTGVVPDRPVFYQREAANRGTCQLAGTPVAHGDAAYLWVTVNSSHGALVTRTRQTLT